MAGTGSYLKPAVASCFLVFFYCLETAASDILVNLVEEHLSM